MLSQTEAEMLISLKKKREKDNTYDFPFSNEYLNIPIISIDGKESFLIDINRKGTIRLLKCTFQERYQGTNILIRLDIDGPPHTNPTVSSVPMPELKPYNGKTIQCPHLHIYVEGFMDNWAIPILNDKFSNTNDLYLTMEDFFCFCNVIEPPIIERSLF